MSEAPQSVYIGVEWDDDELLWFAFGDVNLSVDQQDLGWALSEEDAAWIREGVVVLGERLDDDPEIAPRNFPDASADDVAARMRGAIERFDAWLEERDVEPPMRRTRVTFNAEEVVREFEGGGFHDAPVLASFAAGLASASLCQGTHTVDDWLRSLDEDRLAALVDLLEATDDDDASTPPTLEGAARYSRGVQAVTLVGGLVWLESGEGVDQEDLARYSTALLTLASMELAKRHGLVEFEGERRLTSPDATLFVRATPKGMRLADGEPEALDQPGSPEAPPDALN